MLKICPKCGKFYDDADLRFCFLDGVFLIEAGENLRREGAEKVRLEKLFQKREIFRVKTNNFLMISVTTVLMIMIFSVIVINSWLYFNTENESETVKNETPLQTSTIENSPTPNVKKTILSTPEKTKTPKIENEENDAPQSCSVEEKQTIETEIIKKFEKDWLAEAQKYQKQVRENRIIELKKTCGKYDAECSRFFDYTKVEFVGTTGNPIISSTDCQTAVATIGFEWKSITRDSKTQNFVIPKKFNYLKIENNWEKN